MNDFIHPQVDSGFGFTCDEEILPFIVALYSVGMKTLGSCQGIHASNQGIVVSLKIKAYPRRWVAYTHDNPQIVFNFATHVRDNLLGIDGWGQSIAIDHYTVPDVIYGKLEFVYSLDSKIMSIIRSSLSEKNKCQL
jgi:hypothetical protein